MPQPSWAGIITAFASVLSASALVISALALLLPILRRTKAVDNKVNEVAGKVNQVHTLVNQQRTDALNYQVALVNALLAAGINVPVDQSLGAKTEPPAATLVKAILANGTADPDGEQP